MYDLGETSGVDNVTLLNSETPSHNHFVTAQTVDQGDNRIPGAAHNLGNTQIYVATRDQRRASTRARSMSVGGTSPTTT